MRPHFTSHHSAVELARYDLRKGSEVLGGTVIARSASKVRECFEQFGACGFVHITLSAPEGIWLDRETWLDSMRFVLNRHKFPVGLTPWVMARHTDTSGDHAHAFVALETLEFREIRPIRSKSHTSETHQLLAERLGLPIPEYFSPAAPPRIHGSVPLRRLNRDPEYQRLADDLNSGLATWPENLDALNDSLSAVASPYQITEDVNLYGHPSLVCESATRRIRPSALGDAFFPVNLRKRLDWAGRLTRARLNLDMAVLLNTPEILRALDHAEHDYSDHEQSLKGSPPIAHEDRKTSTSGPGQDGEIKRRVEKDQGGRADPPPPAGLAAGPGRLRPGEDGSDPPDQDDYGHENQAGNHRGRSGRHQGGGDHDTGTDRQDGENPWSSRYDPKLSDGLTLLGWIARVLAIARRVTPGFRHSLDTLTRSLSLKFWDQSAVAVFPDRVTLEAAGYTSSSHARRFTAAYASDLEHHIVLKGIIDPSIRLTPGMTLSSRNIPANERRPFQLICLELGLDPVLDLKRLFHRALKNERVNGSIRRARDTFELRQDQPRALVIGPHAQDLLEACDPSLTSILTEVAASIPHLRCVLPSGIVVKASELALLMTPAPPVMDEKNHEGIPTEYPFEDRPSDDSENPSGEPEPNS